MKIEQEVYSTMTCRDLTEGRGEHYALYHFKKEEDAIKAGKGLYVMGSNCPVKKQTLSFVIYDSWAEFQIDQNNKRVKTALGKLSKEEIEALGLDTLKIT